MNILNSNFYPLYSFEDVQYFLRDCDNFYIVGELYLSKKVEKKIKNKYGKKIERFIEVKEDIRDFEKEFKNIKKKKIKLIVASHHSFEISKNLIDAFNLEYLRHFVTFDHINLSENPIFHNSAGRFFCEHYETHNKKYLEAYNLLSDSLSKITYKKLINYRIKAFNPELMDYDDLPMQVLLQYEYERNGNLICRFLPEHIDASLRKDIAFKLSVDPYSYLNIVSCLEKRHIFNIGAYNNTSVLFALSSKHSKIYTFEPQTLIHEQNVRLSEIYPQIIPICKGIWKETTLAPFSIKECEIGGTTSSAIQENGNCYIKVLSIDDFVEENAIQPDFIKMDIEGAEMEALEGAKNTIQKYLPDLAISIYHKAEHLYEIPIWIKSINEKYKIYVGHKYYNFTETVCFAKVV